MLVTFQHKTLNGKVMERMACVESPVLLRAFCRSTEARCQECCTSDTPRQMSQSYRMYRALFLIPSRLQGFTVRIFMYLHIHKSGYLA